MFKNKHLMTIIAFLVAFTATVMVLVGVPMYKSWSQTPTPTPTTTDQCLHTPGIYQYPSGHDWYPCGYKFSIKHYGFCEQDSPCHCDHQPLECVYVVFVNYTAETVAAIIPMGLQEISSSCSGDGVPETYWCCNVHVPRGEEIVDNHTTYYRWKYFFTCDGGSRMPTTSSIFNEFNTSDYAGCIGFDYKLCTMDLDCD